MIYLSRCLHRILCPATLLLLFVMTICVPVFTSVAQGKSALYRSNLEAFSLAYGDTAAIANLIQAGRTKRADLDFDSAVYFMKQALFGSRQRAYAPGIALALFHLGGIYEHQAKFLQAKDYFLEALPYCRYLIREDPVLWSKVNLCLGQVNAELGWSDSSIYYYQQVLDFLRKGGVRDTVVLYTVHLMLSNTFMDKSMYDQALTYARTAEKFSMAIKDSLNLAMIYNNIGIIYKQKQNDDSALFFLDKAIQLARNGGYKGGRNLIPNAYCYIGVLYFDKDNVQVGMRYFDSAVAADRRGADDNPILQQCLGWAHLKLGNYRTARKHLEQAVALNSKSGSLRKNMYVYMHLANAYDQLGYKDLTIKTLKKYAAIREEFLDEEKINSINQLEVENRVIEKDKILLEQQLLLKDKEVKIRDQNFWIFVLSLSGCFLLIVMLSRHRAKRKAVAEQERNLEQLKQIEHLNSRMEGASEERERIARELHDGVHVLLSAARMTFSSLGKEHSHLSDAVTYKDGMQLLQEVRQEVRNITYQLVPELLVRQSLPAALQALCELIQKGTGISIAIQSFGSFKHLDTQYAYAVYRILQELLHNIVKHAQATEVLVQLMLREGMLHLTVEDNGNGFETEKSYAGMGLANLKARVAQWKGSLFFNSEPGMGTTVEIEFITDNPTAEVNPTDHDNN